MKIGSAIAHHVISPGSVRRRALTRDAIPSDKVPLSNKVVLKEQNRQGPTARQFVHRFTPVQQKAIDFYNITASIGNHEGEGELVGVDTYA